MCNQFISNNLSKYHLYVFNLIAVTAGYIFTKLNCFSNSHFNSFAKMYSNRLTLVLLLLPCLALAAHLPSAGRIIGGHTAGVGQFPYQVSLRRADTNRHFCGAVIIRPTWLVTAAHCVEPGQHQNVRAWVGAHDLNETGTALGVIEIINHPEYVHM